jgi:hypothetical protein
MDPNDPFVGAVRRSFFLSTLVLPAALLAVGVLAPGARAFIAGGGDLLIGMLLIIVPVLIRSRRPEIFPSLFHVGNIGYAAILFSRAVLLDHPRAFLIAFLWVIMTMLLSFRKVLDHYVNLYVMVVHIIVMMSLVYGVLSWIHG